MKKISQEYFKTYQLKMPLEISKIIEISDPVYTFSAVLNHIDLKKYAVFLQLHLQKHLRAPTDGAFFLFAEFRY